MSGSKKSNAQLGLPDGFDIWSPFPFAGVNQSASRIAMDDKQFFWLENYIKVGDGALRTLWDAGAALYTTSGASIVSFFWFNIGQSIYVMVFLADGTAVQVAYPGGAETVVTTEAGLFYSSGNGQLPACCQFGTQYLLISNRNTDNDYWVWDGSILYTAGTVGPASGSVTDGGSGYTSVPAYTVYGGHGTGVVLTPTILDGSVVSLQVTNPGSGYLPGEIVQVGFSGGGTDTTPILEATLYAGVSFLSLISKGSGYPTGTFALSFTGGGGSGATGTFSTSGGQVTAIALTGVGAYSDTPSVGFPIPGSGAAITATESGGSITVLTITAGGTGYVTGTYPLAFTGGAGSGAAATYTVNSSGVVASTTITAPGTGYTSAPAVSLPTGSGAVAVASLSSGVASITIIDGGTGLTGTPILTITGGGGTGATAVATITSGVITSVAVTASGTGYSSAPAVEVETGVNAAAYAMLQLTPFGISGVTIETYQQRVWIAYPNQAGQESTGGTMFVSAPGSLSDFATSDGGDIFSNTDRFLRQQYTFLRQTSNFLYAIGDSSTSVISNVQTSSNPATTTFSYQNTDPQIGSSWRDSAQDFSNTILFANAFGVFGLYGGSVRKISKDLDAIFDSIILPPTAGALTPTAAVANIYSQKLYLLLCTITDPFTAAPRNVMLAWDQQSWYIASQSPALVYLGTKETNSDLQAWGTDGTSLYPLFDTPSATLPKTLATKLYGGSTAFMVKMLHSMYLSAVDRSEGQEGITFSSASVVGMGLALPAQNSVTQAVISAPSTVQKFSRSLTFQAPYPTGAMYGLGAPQVPGVALGVNLVSSSPDFVLSNLQLGNIKYSGVA